MTKPTIALAALLLTGCPSRATETAPECTERTAVLGGLVTDLGCMNGARIQVEKIGEEIIAKCVCPEKKP